MEIMYYQRPGWHILQDPGVGLGEGRQGRGTLTFLVASCVTSTISMRFCFFPSSRKKLLHLPSGASPGGWMRQYIQVRGLVKGHVWSKHLISSRWREVKLIISPWHCGILCGIWKELDRAVPAHIESAPGTFLHENEAKERPACTPGVRLGKERLKKNKLLCAFRNKQGRMPVCLQGWLWGSRRRWGWKKSSSLCATAPCELFSLASITFSI